MPMQMKFARLSQTTQLCASVLCMWGIGIAAAHDPGYTVSEIAPLLGDVSSGATGINDGGEVVGWSEDAFGTRRAFLWQDGTISELLTPPNVVTSTANAINDSGIIVGTAEFDDGSIHAVAWDNLVFIDLTPAADFGDGGCFGLNTSANRLVGGAFVNALSEERGIAWVGGAPNLLPTLASNCAAFDINEHNDIVGWSEDVNGDRHAFFYDASEGAMVDLGVFVDGVESFATAINDEGVITGYGTVAGEDPGTYSFKYDPVIGELENLGSLGSDTSHAFDISAAEFIVGSSILLGSGDENAVLWRPDRMININSLLLPGSDWDYLIRAKAINNEGQVVGSGVIDENQHAFLLEPVLGLADPIPGVAGIKNTFDAAGASPGNTVVFVYGFAWGSTNIPQCPGATLNIKKPKIMAQRKADLIGHAIFELQVPQAAKNKVVIFQAVEPATCEVSAPTSWTFH